MFGLTSLNFLAFLFLACLLISSLIDAIKWGESLPYRQIVKANDSGPAEFLWQYEIQATDNIAADKALFISCGYINNSMLVRLVRKMNDDGQLAIDKDTSKHGDVFGDRLQIYTPTGENDNRVVGFTIDPVRKTDPDMFKCTAWAIQTTGLSEAFHSNTSTLSILGDQGPTFTGPNFTNCLENLPTVISGSNLEFTCEAAGTPTPSLMCNVLSYTGAVLETIPQTGFKEQNLTRQIVEDISYKARKIKCIAKTNVSGPIEVTKDIDIKHPPFAPLEVTIERVNSTSARVQWSSIRGNETGSDAPDYKLDYYMSRLGLNNKTTAALPNPKAGERYTTFEVTGLVANEGYIMAVYGHNIFGNGQKATAHLPMVLKTTAASKTTPSSSNRLKSTLTLLLICIVLNVYN